MIALVLGVMTTIAVAWAGAYFETAYKSKAIVETLVFDEFSCEYNVTTGHTVTRIGLGWSDFPKFTPLPSYWINATTSAHKASVPQWSQAWLKTMPTRPPSLWGNGNSISHLHEFAAGWPCRALRSESDEGTHNKEANTIEYPPSRGGITLPCHVIRDGATVFLPRSLPYRPLIGGFAFNTIFFSTLWMLLMLIPAARRVCRLGKNRCTTCNYDRRGLPSDESPCPECGAMKPVLTWWSRK